MSRTKVGLVVALIATLCLGGVGAAFGLVWALKRARAYLAGTEDAVPVEAGTEHRSERLHYGVRVPGPGWRRLPSDFDPEADVAFTKDDLVYVVIVAEESDQELDDLVRFVEENMDSVSDSTTVVRRSPETVGDVPARRLEFRSRLGGDYLYYWFGLVAHRGYSYQVIAWCEASDESRYRGTLSDWLATLQFHHDGPARSVEEAFPSPAVTPAPPPPETMRLRAAFLRRAQEVHRPSGRAWISDCVASPDGRRLALVSGGQLTLVELSTGHEQVVEGSQGARAPVWDPSGRRVAFLLDGRLAYARIDPVSLETTGLVASAAALLPDGSAVVFEPSIQAELDWASPPSAGGRWTTDLGPVGDALETGDVLAAALDPRGRRLAYVSNAELPGARPGEGNLFVVRLDGGDSRRRLTSGLETFQSVAWNAAGDRILCSRTLDANGDGRLDSHRDRTDLYALDPETGESTCLTRSTGYSLPSVDRAGNLYFVAAHDAAGAYATAVHRIALAAALETARSLPPWPRVATVADCEAVATAIRAAFAPSIAGGEPSIDRATIEAASRLFASAIRERLGVELPLAPEGLERLVEILGSAYELRFADPAFTLGAASLYGLALEALTGAEWSLDGGAAEWNLPRDALDSPHAFALFPLAQVHEFLTREEVGLPIGLDALRREAAGRPIRLALSSEAARRAAREAGGERAVDADRLWEAGDRKAAAAILLELARERPTNRALRHWIGPRLAAAGRLDDYAALLSAAVETDPGDARARRNLALLLLGSTPTTAVEHLREAIRHDPHHGKTYYDLGRAYLTLGQPELARICLDQAIEHYGSHQAAARRLRESLRGER